jgi:two-component system NtrC family sensor kinase
MEEQVRVLCVDDEKNVLRALERLFLDDDYELITATSGSEGLEILRSVSPVHLVISDYRMPGMNGVDFLKEVCHDWPTTVRIVLSGYADTAAIVSAINEGQIYKFIPKPWNDDELKVTVANAVERYFLFKKNLELTSELRKKNEELTGLNRELKKLLDEKSANLEFRGQVLAAHQNILDSMPVGIVGVDLNNVVVLINSAWNAIWGEAALPLGSNIKDAAPDFIGRFVDEVKRARRAKEKIETDGYRGTLSGVLMDQPNDQEGIIVIYSPEDGKE